jgi:cystathionine gamma-synthase
MRLYYTKKMHFDTLALRAGNQPDPTGAVVPPIHLSVKFERDENYEYGAGYEYSRGKNPNRDTLERALAILENGQTAMCFGSGQAATMTLLQALGPGDHVVLPRDAYYNTPNLVEHVFHGWGLTYTRVDMADLDAVKAALHENTRLVWTETPSNPRLTMTDLLFVSQLAHDAGAVVVCDNTWATPVLQRPLALNCDIVMHSTTKYLNGHNDVLGGALVFRDAESALAQRVRFLQRMAGAVPSPFDCWLTLRGLKTLALRVRAQTQTAQKIAEYLADHPAIERVYYPGLPTHPGYELARQQMDAPGAMLSIDVKGGAEEAIAVCQKTKLFVKATSLGGVESLIEHRATVEGITPQTPVSLLRISIGLEHPDDLIQDLAQALG